MEVRGSLEGKAGDPRAVWVMQPVALQPGSWKGRGMESDLPQEAAWPPPGLVLTSVPRSCRSYCFGPRSLWWFVTATSENNTLSLWAVWFGENTMQTRNADCQPHPSKPSPGEVGGRPLSLWKLSRRCPEEKLMGADLSEEGGPLIKGKERV